MRRADAFDAAAASSSAALSCCSRMKATWETSPGPSTGRWGGSSGEALRGMFRELALNGVSALTMTGCKPVSVIGHSHDSWASTYLEAQASFAKILQLRL